MPHRLRHSIYADPDIVDLCNNRQSEVRLPDWRRSNIIIGNGAAHNAANNVAFTPTYSDAFYVSSLDTEGPSVRVLCDDQH